jgi:hypothetical protein
MLGWAFGKFAECGLGAILRRAYQLSLSRS